MIVLKCEPASIVPIRPRAYAREEPERNRRKRTSPFLKDNHFFLCASFPSTISASIAKNIHGGPAVANKAAAQYNEWHHGAVFGIVEVSDPINVKTRCQRGWDTVETENSFLTGLVSGLTYGLYTPREANVVCK
jgi:hypothetical protein